MMVLNQYLLEHRKEKKIRFFFDLETLQYNEEQGRKKPSYYKNITYALGVGFYYNDKVHVKLFKNIKYFFDIIIETYKFWKKTPRIELIAHNNNKYDNHFIRKELIYYYDTEIKNLYLRNATDLGNINSHRKTKIKNREKLILEKRIKSRNNLELTFFLNGIEFETVDNFMKTNVSIATLGQKLLRINAITENELKTDYNYSEFNSDYDMTNTQAHKYAYEVFKNLTEEQKHYIRNDIIILAKSVIHYSKIFKGFDYNKITFTSNILEYYNDNDLTSFQLLNSIGQGKDKVHIKYTDYFFSNENFYDYLKSFYAGGMNFYNDRLVGKIIKYKVTAIDINSSYPYVMHNFKIPTVINNFEEFPIPTKIKIDYKNDDIYYLYRMSKEDFDREIIRLIDSRNIRKMLVKYYGSKKYININSYTFKLIENIAKIKIDELSVLSYVSFNCYYFGSREKIEQQYKIKEQGSSKYKLIYNSPYDIIKTNELNENPFSPEEVDNSKVVLNGLYGIPALRSHFNIFRLLENDELENIENGYQNNERNIVFSIFVTSVSLFNLLSPLAFFTVEEIDKYFIYCDTDSLYFHHKLLSKIPSDFFNPHHLGSWDIDYETIDKFYVLNHKKYVLQYYDVEKNKDIIKVKCGGIPNDSFDFDMSFEKFVETQFSDGVKIKNNKSIYNKDETISIYPSTTDLQIGKGYRIWSHNPYIDEMEKEMLQEIEKQKEEHSDDVLYIESNIGTYSMTDLNPFINESKDKLNLNYLKIAEKSVFKMIDINEKLVYS